MSWHSRQFVSALSLALLITLLGASMPAALAEPKGPPDLTWGSARDEAFYRPRAYPNASFPAGGLPRAREQRLERERSGSLLRAAPERSARAVVESNWEQIGPAPIQSTSSVGLPGAPPPNSGRVTALAAVDRNIAYLGAADGGVWRTIDGGLNWEPTSDNQLTLAIGSLAVDPSNPNVVYAGTGEANGSSDSYFGYGVLKSVDAAATWQLYNTGNIFTRQHIATVAVDPNNPQLVYAASTNGVARSTNGGVDWALFTIGSGGAITDLVIDARTNPSTVFAARGKAVGIDDVESERGIYRSTTASTTWTKVPGTGTQVFPATRVGRIRLAATSTTPTVLFAIVADAVTDGILGIWRTADGGAMWTPTGHPEIDTDPGEEEEEFQSDRCNQCDYNLGIAVDPADPNQLYALGTEGYRSFNGGATWQLFTYGYTKDPTGIYRTHVDQHAFSFIPGHPAGGDAFYIGNDGGVWKSFNAGDNLINLNSSPTSTLAISQFSGGAAHPTNPQIAIGGTQDNGTVAFNGFPFDWYRSFGGDGGFAVIDYQNPDNVYGSTQYLGIRRSTSGTRGAFLPATNGIPPSPDPERPDPAAEPRQFYGPIEIDPTNPAVLYTGTTRVYRTINHAELWAPISPVLAVSSTVTTIAVAPSMTSTLYVATVPARGAPAGSRTAVFLSPNSGGAWTARSGGLPNRVITRLAVSPDDPNTAYAALSGFDAPNTPAGVGHVYKTTNGGQTWTNSTGSLPDAPANAILVDPADPSLLYVATDVGVFKSTNAGASWVSLNAGLPNVVVSDLVLNRAGTALFAFTHGRSAYAASRQVTPGTPTATPVVPELPPLWLFASGLLLLVGLMRRAGRR